MRKNASASLVFQSLGFSSILVASYSIFCGAVTYSNTTKKLCHKGSLDPVAKAEDGDSSGAQTEFNVDAFMPNVIFDSEAAKILSEKDIRSLVSCLEDVKHIKHWIRIAGLCGELRWNTSLSHLFNFVRRPIDTQAITSGEMKLFIRAKSVALVAIGQIGNKESVAFLIEAINKQEEESFGITPTSVSLAPPPLQGDQIKVLSTFLNQAVRGLGFAEDESAFQYLKSRYHEVYINSSDTPGNRDREQMLKEALYGAYASAFAINEVRNRLGYEGFSSLFGSPEMEEETRRTLRRWSEKTE